MPELPELPDMHDMPRTPTATLLAALLATALAAPALAGSVTLTLENGTFGGDPFNTVRFGLTNTSAPGINLTGWSLTVGDTQFLFDQLYLSEETFTPNTDAPTAALANDTNLREDNGLGQDAFTYTFTNFTPATTFSGQWDIDNDNGDFQANARTVLFNNGDAANALATFTFSDGSAINYTFPDLPIQDRYSIDIPTPAGAGVLALAALGVGRRRR